MDGHAGGDVARQFHGNGERAQLLDRLSQLDFPAVDGEALFGQALRDVFRGDRPEHLVVLADLGDHGERDGGDLFRQRFDLQSLFLRLFCHDALRMFKGLDVAAVRLERLPARQEIVARETVRDIDQIAQMADPFERFLENHFHDPNSFCWKGKKNTDRTTKSQFAVLSHLKSYRATDRCVMCQSSPLGPHGAGPKEGEDGGRANGATIQARVSAGHVAAGSTSESPGAVGAARRSDAGVSVSSPVCQWAPESTDAAKAAGAPGDAAAADVWGGGDSPARPGLGSLGVALRPAVEGGHPALAA